MESSHTILPSFYNIFIGTIAGGVITNIVFNPFDVVKNYWYYNHTINKCRTQMSSLDVAKHIYKNNGLTSFWLGFGWATPLTIFSHTTFFYSYDHLKNNFSPPVASLLSRLVSLGFFQPLDCMRTYSQAILYTTQRQNLFDVVKNNGFRALYKGSYTTLIRDIPFSTIHWPINEFCYKKITNIDMYKKRKMTQIESIAIPFFCGSFSSLIATFVSQPFDIIKTNLQTTGVDSEEAKSHKTETGKLNMLTELRRIKKTYGIRGFFIGVAPRLIKVVPGSAIMSAAYHFFN